MGTAVETVGCLLAMLTLLAGVYAVSCWLHPLRLCRECRGTGRQRAAIFRAYRVCTYCAGSGTKLRVGRSIYERARRR